MRIILQRISPTLGLKLIVHRLSQILAGYDFYAPFGESEIFAIYEE